MLIDLHCHEMTHSKCSSMCIEDMVSAAKAKCLDAICITDHDSMNIRYTKADFIRSINFTIFVGIEISSMHGDIIAFGVEFDFETYMMETQEIVDYVNLNNGFCYAAHPFRGSGCGYYTYNLKNLHGIEVRNGRCEEDANERAMGLCKEMGLIQLAGSDAHEIDQIGKYPMKLPDSVTTLKDLVNILKSGYANFNK